MKHTKKKVMRRVNTAKTALTTGAMSLLAFPQTVKAGGIAGADTAANVVGEGIRFIVGIGGGLAGAIFIIMGLIKLLTAWHNGQPQEMHASVKDLIVGAAFVGLALLTGPALTALGL